MSVIPISKREPVLIVRGEPPKGTVFFVFFFCAFPKLFPSLSTSFTSVAAIFRSMARLDRRQRLQDAGDLVCRTSGHIMRWDHEHCAVRHCVMLLVYAENTAGWSWRRPGEAGPSSSSSARLAGPSWPWLHVV